MWYEETVNELLVVGGNSVQLNMVTSCSTDFIVLHAPLLETHFEVIINIDTRNHIFLYIFILLSLIYVLQWFISCEIVVC